MKNAFSKICLTALLSIAIFPFSWAEDKPAKPAKPWKNETEISYVGTNGNTKASTAAGKETFNYKWSKTNLEVMGSGLSSKDKGVHTAEEYAASEKVDYSLSERNYTYEKFKWDKNRFAGIDNRYDSNVGVGRKLIVDPKNNLIGEIGVGYINEDRTVGPVNDFTSNRAYSKYVRTVSPTSNFSQDAEYLGSFDDSADFRVNTETALTAAISVHFSMKISYKWKYVAEPPVGFGRNDTITAFALLANY